MEKSGFIVTSEARKSALEKLRKDFGRGLKELKKAKDEAKSLDWSDKSVEEKFAHLYKRRMRRHEHHERSQLLKEIKREKRIG